MWETANHEAWAEELYIAGQRVRPGVYQQLGSRRKIRLEHEDVLPASLDGRVACYERVAQTWAQIADPIGSFS